MCSSENIGQISYEIHKPKVEKNPRNIGHDEPERRSPRGNSKVLRKIIGKTDDYRHSESGTDRRRPNKH